MANGKREYISGVVLFIINLLNYVDRYTVAGEFLFSLFSIFIEIIIQRFPVKRIPMKWLASFGVSLMIQPSETQLRA